LELGTNSQLVSAAQCWGEPPVSSLLANRTGKKIGYNLKSSGKKLVKKIYKISIWSKKEKRKKLGSILEKLVQYGGKHLVNSKNIMNVDTQIVSVVQALHWSPTFLLQRDNLLYILTPKFYGDLRPELLLQNTHTQSKAMVFIYI